MWREEKEERWERIKEDLIDLVSYLIFWGIMFAGVLKLLQII